VENKSNVSHHRNFLISGLIPAPLCSQIVGTIVKASRSEYTIDFCITWACRAFRILERNGFHRIACKWPNICSIN